MTSRELDHYADVQLLPGKAAVVKLVVVLAGIRNYCIQEAK